MEAMQKYQGEKQLQLTQPFHSKDIESLDLDRIKRLIDTYFPPLL
jgi:hypothetical protein